MGGLSSAHTAGKTITETLIERGREAFSEDCWSRVKIFTIGETEISTPLTHRLVSLQHWHEPARKHGWAAVNGTDTHAC